MSYFRNASKLYPLVCQATCRHLASTVKVAYHKPSQTTMATVGRIARSLKSPTKTDPDEIILQFKRIHKERCMVPIEFYKDLINIVAVQHDTLRAESVLRLAYRNVTAGFPQLSPSFLSSNSMIDDVDDGVINDSVLTRQSTELPTDITNPESISAASGDIFHDLVFHTIKQCIAQQHPVSALSLWNTIPELTYGTFAGHQRLCEEVLALMSDGSLSGMVKRPASAALLSSTGTGVASECTDDHTAIDSQNSIVLLRHIQELYTANNWNMTNDLKVQLLNAHNKQLHGSSELNFEDLSAVVDHLTALHAKWYGVEPNSELEKSWVDVWISASLSVHRLSDMQLCGGSPVSPPLATAVGSNCLHTCIARLLSASSTYLSSHVAATEPLIRNPFSHPLTSTVREVTKCLAVCGWVEDAMTMLRQVSPCVYDGNNQEGHQYLVALCSDIIESSKDASCLRFSKFSAAEGTDRGLLDYQERLEQTNRLASLLLTVPCTHNAGKLILDHRVDIQQFRVAWVEGMSVTPPHIHRQHVHFNRYNALGQGTDSDDRENNRLGNSFYFHRLDDNDVVYRYRRNPEVVQMFLDSDHSGSRRALLQCTRCHSDVEVAYRTALGVLYPDASSSFSVDAGLPPGATAKEYVAVVKLLCRSLDSAALLLAQSLLPSLVAAVGSVGGDSEKAMEGAVMVLNTCTVMIRSAMENYTLTPTPLLLSQQQSNEQNQAGKKLARVCQLIEEHSRNILQPPTNRTSKMSEYMHLFDDFGDGDDASDGNVYKPKSAAAVKATSGKDQRLAQLREQRATAMWQLKEQLFFAHCKLPKQITKTLQLINELGSSDGDGGDTSDSSKEQRKGKRRNLLVKTHTGNSDANGDQLQRQHFVALVDALYYSYPKNYEAHMLVKEVGPLCVWVCESLKQHHLALDDELVCGLIRLYAKAAQMTNIESTKRKLVSEAVGFLTACGQGSVGHSEVEVSSLAVREIVKACCMTGQVSRGLRVAEDSMMLFNVPSTPMLFEPIVFHAANKAQSVEEGEATIMKLLNKNLEPLTGRMLESLMLGGLQGCNPYDTMKQMQDFHNQHQVTPRMAVSSMFLESVLLTKDTTLANAVVEQIRYMYGDAMLESKPEECLAYRELRARFAWHGVPLVIPSKQASF